MRKNVLNEPDDDLPVPLERMHRTLFRDQDIVPPKPLDLLPE